MLCSPIALELEAAIQRMVNQLYGRECAQIAPPAVLMAVGEIQMCSLQKDR